MILEFPEQSNYYNISRYVLFEASYVSTVYKNFIDSVYQLIYKVKEETYNPELYDFYKNNVLYTGWSYDGTKPVQTEDEKKFHPIYLKFHFSKLRVDYTRSELEFKYFNLVNPYDVEDNLGRMCIEPRKDYGDKNEPIVIHIFLDNYINRKELYFNASRDFANECVHIEDEYSESSSGIPNNHIHYKDIDYDYFKNNGVNLEKTTVAEKCIDFTISILYILSPAERKTVQSQIDDFCEKCRNYIIDEIRTANISLNVHNDIVDYFIHKFDKLYFGNVKNTVSMIEQFEKYIQNKELVPFIMVITECVKCGLFNDRFSLFGNYDLLNKAISGELVIDERIEMAIKDFFLFFEKQFDSYLEELRKYVDEAFVDNDIYKPIMLNENYNAKSMSYNGFMLCESADYIPFVFKNFLKESVESGLITEQDARVLSIMNFIDTEKLMWYSYGDYARKPAEIYFE